GGTNRPTIGAGRFHDSDVRSFDAGCDVGFLQPRVEILIEFFSRECLLAKDGELDGLLIELARFALLLVELVLDLLLSLLGELKVGACEAGDLLHLGSNLALASAICVSSSRIWRLFLSIATES